MPPITVLLVDDDERLRELVREYVGRYHDGVTVDTASDGGEALARMETIDDVDCVVSDYAMPGMNGLELLQAVRDRWPALPFILFTGRGSEEIAEEAIRAGVTDYLQKGGGTSQFAVLANRVRNVVAHRRTEVELEHVAQRTEAQFDLLLEAVEDYAIFLLDEEGFIRTWNGGAEHIKGYTRDEIVGEHFSVFYREEDVEAGVPERNIREAAENGRVSDEGWRVRKDGSEFWADVRIVALRDEGELVGYAKVTRDNSQQKRERDLLDQKEQLEGFIAAISHDLRNPLSTAGGNVKLARETGDLSRLDAAEKALARATRLLSYIGKVAEDGEHVRVPAQVDLREVAEAAWSVVETDGATLVVEEGATIVADRWRLLQLFENLFANAVEHAGPDVTVSVGPLDVGGFYVRDDGPGVPEAERRKVFERGYSGTADGTGFGLAICEQIASFHGWSIEVTDGSDGGALFEITGVETGRGH